MRLSCLHEHVVMRIVAQFNNQRICSVHLLFFGPSGQNCKPCFNLNHSNKFHYQPASNSTTLTLVGVMYKM